MVDTTFPRKIFKGAMVKFTHSLFVVPLGRIRHTPKTINILLGDGATHFRIQV